VVVYDNGQPLSSLDYRNAELARSRNAVISTAPTASSTSTRQVSKIYAYTSWHTVPNNAIYGAFATTVYTINIVYTDGTQVFSTIWDASYTSNEYYACGQYWTTGWHSKIALGNDRNVYVTSTMIVRSLPTPSQCPTHLPFARSSAPNGSVVHGFTRAYDAQMAMGRTHGFITSPQRFVAKLSRPELTACDGAATTAAILGALVGSTVTVDGALGLGAAVGTLLGPEGTYAGIIFGAYAIGAVGASRYGSLVGAGVFSLIARALCENLTAPTPKEPRRPDHSTPVQFADQPNVILVPTPRYSVTITCCEPIPMPTP